MKIIGYLLFAGIYYIFRLFCPIQKKKVFCIMTHDSSRNSNIGFIVQYLKSEQEGYSFRYLKKTDGRFVKNLGIIKGILSFFIVKPYHMATSEYIFLDNIFLPMAYMRFRKGVSVVQLWHGTGTIKKFGQDVNTGQLRKLEAKANNNITHLIVNSDRTKLEYSGAFGVKEDKVFIYGLPRTDIFFNATTMAKNKDKFYYEYPDLKGKKLILYVPTFRDNEVDHPQIILDTEVLHNQLPDEYVILLRLHPFVADAFEKDMASSGTLGTIRGGKVISMSTYSDISTLLFVSDVLITDYSSVIFEYCLMERPMIFYAHDLEQFSENGRGFYQPYEEFIPGPIVQDTESIVELIKKDQFDLGKIRDFKRNNYKYLDGRARERIFQNILKH